jgi:hypothetical protein
MGFLIRTAIVVTIGIMLIPADPAELARTGKASEVSTLGTLVFMKTAWDDARGFCDRNAEACTTAGQFGDLFQAKARTGAKWIYGFLGPSSPTPASARPFPAVDATATGSLPPPRPVPRRKPADLQPHFAAS